MEDLADQFRPIAENYRTKEKRRLRIVVYFVASCLIGIFIGNTDSSLLKVCWFLNIAAVILVFFTNSAKAPCPACHQNVVQGIGPRCPACGGVLRKLGVMRGQECEVCKLRPQYNRGGRNFRIRHCTHCGARLHEAGL